MIEELDGFCVQGKVIGVLKQKMVPKVTNTQNRPDLLPNLSKMYQTVIKQNKNKPDVTMMGGEEARGEKMSTECLTWPTCLAV